MSDWRPDIAGRAGPKYEAIADVIAEDVATGRLGIGTRLPTHRDLAWHLGVTVGTVSRAYAEAERRGLVAGHVGRGTFVQEPAGSRADFHFETSFLEQDAGPINMSFNFPAPGEEIAAIGPTLGALSRDPMVGVLVGYQSHEGLPGQRAAGARWLARCGVQTTQDRVILTAGAHNGMSVVLTALTQPGDRMVTDELTYPGIQPLTRSCGVRLDPLAMDDDGILPEAFEAACRQGDLRALYTVPTFQNPTNIVMPLERRQQIAGIASQHQVAIIEDDIFSPLIDNPPPPLTSLAPDVGYYIASLSKALAPGLRIAYVTGPEGSTALLARATRISCWMASPLSGEIAARWIMDGTGDRILASRRVESEKRRQIALAKFDGFDFDCPKGAMHVWLRLPEPWRSSEFVAEARRRGVLVTPADVFVVGRGATPHAVRICLGPPRQIETVEAGLAVIASLLTEGPVAVTEIV